MKTAFGIFFCSLLLFSCHEEFTVSDASLKINIKKITNVCECNDALILLMKENKDILTEFKRVGKESPDIEKLNKEYKKRIDKFNEIFKHCFPMFQKPGADYNCSNRSEAEKLDKELSSLRKELGME